MFKTKLQLSLSTCVTKKAGILMLRYLLVKSLHTYYKLEKSQEIVSIII